MQVIKLNEEATITRVREVARTAVPPIAEERVDDAVRRHEWRYVAAGDIRCVRVIHRDETAALQGKARPASDIDLLVVGAWPGDTAFHSRRARQLVARCFPPVDLVLCTPTDIAAAEAAPEPFLLSVIENGITVYRRP